MAIFNSYVKLPEGRCSDIPEPPSGFNPLWVQHPSTAYAGTTVGCGHAQCPDLNDALYMVYRWGITTQKRPNLCRMFQAGGSLQSDWWFGCFFSIIYGE